MLGKSKLSRRDFLRTTAVLGLGATMSSSLLAACAPSGPAPAGAPAAAGEAAAGGPTGEATLALAFDLESLDPIKTYSLNNGRWQKNVFGYLVKRDEDMNIVPGGGLALSWEEEDDKNVVFKLREGVTFHNGEPFNADAVVYSFDRLLDEENASPQRFNYTAIDHFEKIDDYTVRMVMAEVDPVIIRKLAGYGAAIVPPGYVEEQGADHVSAVNMPGTGPYKIVEYNKDENLVLEAADNYWGEAPHIKTLNYRIVPDDATRLAEFLSEGVDVLTLTAVPGCCRGRQSRISTSSLSASPRSAGCVWTPASPRPTICRYAPPSPMPLTRRPSSTRCSRGTAAPMAVWQSPYSFGYDPELEPYAYDPEKAKQLLAESGVSDPTLVYNVIGDDALMKEIANAVKAMLEEVGFTVEIAQKERATYFNDYREGKLDNIVPFGWGGWTLDADNTYYSMYYTGESYNPGFSDPEIDVLLDEQRSTLDQAKREEILKQVNKLIYDQYPDAMLYQQQYLWGVTKRVKDLPLPADERLWLAPASVA